MAVLPYILLHLAGAGLIQVLSYPLTSTLLKYRAHYTPKKIQLQFDDDSDGVDRDEGCCLDMERSYIGTFSRVWEQEGFSGYYKGFFPHAFSNVITLALPSLAIVFLRRSQAPPLGPQSAHERLYFLATLLLNVDLLSWVSTLSIPFSIIAARAACSPFSSNTPLLTPAEKRIPFRLFLLPGVLASTLIFNAILFLEGHFARGIWKREDALTLVLLFSFLLLLLMFLRTTVMNALQILWIRLALQPYGGKDTSTMADEEALHQISFATNQLQPRNATQNEDLDDLPLVPSQSRSPSPRTPITRMSIEQTPLSPLVSIPHPHIPHAHQLNALQIPSPNSSPSLASPVSSLTTPLSPPPPNYFDIAHPPSYISLHRPRAFPLLHIPSPVSCNQPPSSSVHSASGEGGDPVVRLRTRTAAKPYVSLHDALQRVIVEEGLDALFRGWWITFLSGAVRVIWIERMLSRMP